MRQIALTTVDNPFDPFTQWDQWWQYDFEKGYFTPEYLARITTSSEAMSEVDQLLALEDGIDAIVYENITGLYRKVERNVEDSGND